MLFFFGFLGLWCCKNVFMCMWMIGSEGGGWMGGALQCTYAIFLMEQCLSSFSQRTERLFTL